MTICRTLPSVVVATALVFVAPMAAVHAQSEPSGLDANTIVQAVTPDAVTHQGNPYVPAGANFKIFAHQGITPSNPFGDAETAAQVNLNFEFTPSIGVSYTGADGKLKDFGIGLYAPMKNAIASTGLEIAYNQPVDASSVTITLEDFDIDTKAIFFNSTKVEPALLLLGPGNTIYGSATPQDIFPNLVPNMAGSAGGKGATDVWDLNFGNLLNTLHLADAPITGFLLYADMNNGEKPSSDPYLLVSAGNGIPAVPEPNSALLIVTGAIGCMVARRWLRPNV